MLNGYIILKEKILLDGLTLAICFRRFSSVKCVCVCFTSNENCHFSSEKNDYLPKRVVDFPLEKDTFRKKIMEIVEDFDEKVTTTTVNPGNRRGFCV